jgi:hypothetical protein
MNPLDVVKTLTHIASEYRCVLKTLKRQIENNPRLKDEILPGLQMPRKQKLIYEEFGYPPGVNKSDYDNI